MKTRVLASDFLAPPLWIACAAALAFGAIGCGDSGTATEKDGAAGGSTGAGTGGKTGSGGTSGPAGSGGQTGTDAAAGGAGGVVVGTGGEVGGNVGTGGARIDGAAGNVGTGGARIDGAAGNVGTGGARIDGAAGNVGTGGARIDGGGTGGATGSGGRTGTGGATGTGGVIGAGGAQGSGGSTATGLSKFSFFVTSLSAMQKLSKNANGFGGDLRYGQADGLAGADKICTEIAEESMAGASAKGWRAFLSTSTVNAIDRVGTGPWYDRLGRIVANTPADLQASRPVGADAAIIDDLPSEWGVPNHNPDHTGQVHNPSTLTGSNMQGKYYGSAASTCNDWTSLTGGQPRVGHSWAVTGVPNWSDAWDAPGCAAGVKLVTSGGGGSTVGDMGGYGGIYCFALTP